MEDLDIYDLAADVLGKITKEIGAARYAELGGELELRWSADEEVVEAYASSRGSPAEPPRHTITIHYAFVRQLWRDAEDFVAFLESIPKGSAADLITRVRTEESETSEPPTPEHRIKNLFVAALTWVYFHELGHLVQEHGYLRAPYAPDMASRTTEVHEVAAAGTAPLEGEAAEVFHVTELAADFEATTFYVVEFARHMTAPEFTGEGNSKFIFDELLYLMVCGLSIVFYRFNGVIPPVLGAVPRGSHPDPVTRLEINLPQIWEALDIVLRSHMGHARTREELVRISQKGATSAAMYWSMTKTQSGRLDEGFLVRGILSRPELFPYLRVIMKRWDKLLPHVLQAKRFGSSLSVLRFTAEFRRRIDDGTLWGQGPEAEVQR